MRTVPVTLDDKRRIFKTVPPASAAQRRRAAAVDLSAVPPLHWWRHLTADAYSAAHLQILRRAISGITFLKEPRWPNAVSGDSAAAIGIALRTAKRHSTPTPTLDLVMSALLLIALPGDPASRLILCAMIDRHSAENERSRLAASWVKHHPNAERTGISSSESSGPHVPKRNPAGA